MKANVTGLATSFSGNKLFMRRSDKQSFKHIADYFQTASDNDQMQFVSFADLPSMKMYGPKHTDAALPSFWIALLL